MTINVLNKATTLQLHSGQVIVDIEAIVKELLENSIDANATSIELVFINNGLESIQVKDNGDGIEEKDRAYVAKRHYTSKISTFEDLESIHSYGFRGEAINSICSISDQVVLATKTRKDPISKQYDADKEGTLHNEKLTNIIPISGTMITVYKPFYDLPVRRQLAQNNAHQYMKKIQDLLIAYALTHTNIRFSSVQSTNTVGYSTNRNSVWVKPVTPSIESSLTVIYGSRLSNMLGRWIETESTSTVDLIIPKSNSDPSVIYKGGDRVFVYVNQRPINYVKSGLKELVSTIRNRYRQCLGLSDTFNKKNPFIYLDIQLEPNEYDVNVEPNKTAVFFHNKQNVYNLVEKAVDRAYPSKATQLFFGSNVTSLLAEEMPNVVQHEHVKDKQSNDVADHHMPSTSEIPPTSSLPEVSNNNEWHFSMDDVDLQLDELESDEADSNNDNTKSKQGQTVNPVTSSPEKSVEKEGDTNAILPQWQIDHSDDISHTSNSIIQQRPMTAAAHSLNVAPPKSSMETPSKHPVTLTNQRRRPSAAAIPLPIQNKNPSPKLVQTQLPFAETIPSPAPCQRDPALSVLEPSQMLNKRPVISQQPSFNKPAPLIPQKRSSPLNNKLLSTSQRVKLPQPSTHTLNEVLTIDYTPRPPIRRDDHLDIYAYLSNCSRNELHHATSFTQVPLGPLTLYTQSLFDEQDQRRIVIEMGVYNTKELFVHLKSKDIPVICKKNLSWPVQIQMGEHDPLCAPLLSLTRKQALVKDDLHGHTNITYTEIIDDLCIKNGFRVRYRRTDHGFVIQFTAITDVIENYGPKDFRELLQFIKDAKGDPKRPSKIVQYVRTINQKQEDDHSEEDLVTALKELTWDGCRDNNWVLGYSSNSDNEEKQVLACKFIGDHHQ